MSCSLVAKFDAEGVVAVTAEADDDDVGVEVPHAATTRRTSAA
jgi:hypothetical protein